MLTLKKHSDNSIGLIGHIIANYPSPDIARTAIDIMVNAGVSLIEIQIPFSDPVADGPLFAQANQHALKNGVTVEHCFALMKEVSAKYKIPFVFMTYGNIIYKKGFSEFAQHAKQAGAAGMIVPDLPPDSAPDYLAACQQYGLAPIQVVPPNVSAQRLPLLAQASQGFIYAVARSGVTGAKTTFVNTEIAAFMQRIRQHSDLPIAVGFGIQSAADIELLKPIADYAIVGSAALRIINEQGLDALRQFWQTLQAAAKAT